MYSFCLIKPVIMMAASTRFEASLGYMNPFLEKKIIIMFVGLNMVVYTCNTSTPDTGARIATSSRLACST